MGAKRETAKYHLKLHGKIVHRGITDRPLEEREREHQDQFPGAKIVKVGRRTTRKQGLEWESEGGKR